MKIRVKALNIISGQLFMIGAVAARVKQIPILIVSPIFSLISLSAYLAAYLVWYTATFFYSKQQRNVRAWYGFSQFREQHQIAAVLGTLATLLCLFSHILIIPAAWIYAISSTIWCIGEYHKKSSPPLEDPLYSSARQAFYFRYTLLTATTAGVSAVAATIIFCFPAALLVTAIASASLSVCLMGTAGYCWARNFFGNFPPDRIAINHAYGVIEQQLGDRVAPNEPRERENEVREIAHMKPLFIPAIAENDPEIAALDLPSPRNAPHG